MHQRKIEEAKTLVVENDFSLVLKDIKFFLFITRDRE
jgi:hypothetical protein